MERERERACVCLRVCERERERKLTACASHCVVWCVSECICTRLPVVVNLCDAVDEKKKKE
jgi:hypothetical protein